MNDQTLLRQIALLTELCDQLQATHRRTVERHPTNYSRSQRILAGELGQPLPHEHTTASESWDEQLAETIRSMGRAVGSKLAVADPDWGANFAKCIHRPGQSGVAKATGCLNAASHLVKAGFLRPARASALADVFADLLDQAEYLLEQGFVAPAAVVAGSALEAHLNELFDCAPELSGEKRPRKAAVTLDALKRVGRFGVADHRQAQAILDVRNAAAHPGHEDHSRIVEEPNRVAEMIRNVREFIVRQPSS